MSSQYRSVEERVVGAAARLAEQDGSLEAVSVDEIARVAGVAKATLYRRFPSKAAIREELVRRGLAVGAPSDDRRTQILDAATRLFPQNGLRGTTVEQVAAEAGVSPATIYWHFGSKEGLMAAMLRGIAPTELVERLASVPDEALPELVLRQLARGVAGRVGMNARVLRMVIVEVGHHPELAGLVFDEVVGPLWARIAAYLDRQVQLGRFRPGDPMARLFCLAGPIMVTLIARETFGERVKVPVETVVEEAVENFLAAVMRPAER
jgi:TetR/AcrR family transcriptional regulator of autoinduction and epiphytic fitness